MLSHKQHHLSDVTEGLAPTINLLASSEPQQAPHAGDEILQGDDEKPVKVQVEDTSRKAPGIQTLKSAYADWPAGKLIRKFWRMYMFGVLVGLAGLYSGYVDAAPGSIVANAGESSPCRSRESGRQADDRAGFIKQFGTVHDPKTGKIALNAQVVSGWGVAQQACSLITQVISPFPLDWFGRRILLGAFVVLGAVACIIEIFAKDWQAWLGAKIVMGICMGLLPCPLTLMAELTFPQMRGNVLCWFAISWCLGGFFCNVGLEIINEIEPTKYLRIIYSEWIFVGVYSLIWLFAPESPSELTFTAMTPRADRTAAWLITVGKIDKAKKTFRYIVGNMEDFDYDHEFAVIEQEVTVSKQLLERQNKAAWRDFFRPVNFKRANIPLLAYCGQQIVGGMYVYSYTTYFFQQAGLKNPFIGSVVVSLVSFFGIVASLFVIERVGRRPLMIYGTLACMIFDFVIGGLSFVPMNNAVGAALITVTALWVFSYGISYYTISECRILQKQVQS